MGQAKYQNGFTPTIHPECMNEPFLVERQQACVRGKYG